MEYRVANSKKYLDLTDQELTQQLEDLDREIRRKQTQIKEREGTPAIPGNKEAIAKLQEELSSLNEEYRDVSGTYGARIKQRKAQLQVPQKTPVQQQYERVREALALAQVELSKLEQMIHQK